MTGVYKLTGTLQHYIWGGKNYIPTLLGIEKDQNQYYAEWWLGAHSSSPSIIEYNKKTQTLIEFLNHNPCVLGTKSRAKFGDELPYLLKILDVEKPLSIQLHPTKDQAERGFAEENTKGIALTDPKRTYKDNNHKPEMMIALSDFWLLHGFKTKSKIAETLKSRPSLSALLTKLNSQSLQHFYSEIMKADQIQLASWLNPIIESNQHAYQKGELTLNNPDYWVLYTIDVMEIKADKLDAGLICFYLFNIVNLKKGEGIFQDAGIPHAYLRGQNIELMACSDNVIRGGLTPKHIDITALLDIIDCREIEPQIIPPAPSTPSEFIYSTPAKDFVLVNINCKSDMIYNQTAKNASILFVMEGVIKITEESNEIELKQGQSAFICANTIYQIHTVADGYCVLATSP